MPPAWPKLRPGGRETTQEEWPPLVKTVLIIKVINIFLKLKKLLTEINRLLKYFSLCRKGEESSLEVLFETNPKWPRIIGKRDNR